MMNRLFRILVVWIILGVATGCAPNAGIDDARLLQARLDGIEAQQRMLIEHQSDQMEAMDDLRKQMLSMQQQMAAIEGQQQSMQHRPDKAKRRPAPKPKPGPTPHVVPRKQAPAAPPRAETRPAPAARLAPEAEAKADAAYEKAYQTLKRGDFRQASEAFAGFMAEHPRSQRLPEARYWLGETEYTQGDFAKAANTLQPFAAMPVNTPKRAPALMRLASSLKQLGRPDAAAREFNRVRIDYPGGVESETARNELKAMGAPEQVPAPAVPPKPKHPAAPKPVPAAAAQAGTWSVNIVSLDNRADAAQEMAHLQSLGIDAGQVEVEVNGRHWYRLRTTGYPSAEAAETERKRMAGLGYTDAWTKSE